MEITEVRIKLMEDSEDRLRAFCSITFDHCFVVRDLKIIDGVNGPFVAMPSRKLTGHCPRCRHKNHLRAQYCNQCGSKLRSGSGDGSDSPQKLYADVAHPINSECREMIQEAVIAELEHELARAGEPGYRSRYDDEFADADLEPSDVTTIRHDAAESAIGQSNRRAGSRPEPKEVSGPGASSRSTSSRATASDDREATGVGESAETFEETEVVAEKVVAERRPGAPPAPHFDRRTMERGGRMQPTDDGDDAFGAGIFD